VNAKLLKSGTAKAVAIFLAGTMFGVLTTVELAPRAKQTVLSTGVVTGPTTAGSVPGQPNVNPTSSGNPATGGELPPALKGLSCARGKNGGATAPGVTGDTIKLATTTVQSGTGAAFLGEVKYAMEAVRNKVNAKGGICGRRLEIKYVDDGWDPQRGAGYLRNFIKEGYFAIPVGPSSEGLRVVLDSLDIDAAGIPVVGTDGMLIDQYQHVTDQTTEPWVWPVAVATASTARLMALDAYKRGARRFSVVFDKTYKFGVEAAEAYNNEVARLLHNKGVDGFNTANNCQKSFCGVLAAQPEYQSEVNEFQPGDFVAMFLEPTTALTWMSTPGAPTASGNAAVKYGVGGAQPLFTYNFANACQTACDQMQVWTSYKPPIERYASDPSVREFVSDLRKTQPSADVNNAFTQGGYIGMKLLVEGLEKVGPALTRERLRAALDTMSFSSGLTQRQVLKWSPTHFANATMQAFTIQYKGTFNGWRSGQIVSDPNPTLGKN
jgi:ABC-type branched-subunit amino acid transport system substrate-binding protein